MNLKPLFQKAMSATLVVVMTLTLMVLAIPTQNAAAAFPAQPNSAPAASVSSFARCVVSSIKLMPQAKKLTPQGYQDFERTLNDVFNGTKYATMNPYVAAVFTGAKIGKFIGFNLVWYIGAVQSCWGQLRR
jgi:hypothetical protein